MPTTQPLRQFRLLFALACATLSLCIPDVTAQLPPVTSVTVDNHRALRVNGQPFLPLMAWLQDAGNFDAVKACGMNTLAGYWPKSSNTKDVVEYQALVAKAGLYGVMPYDAGLRGNANLLGYIHGDEPDLPHLVNDAVVKPDPKLRLNRSTPLWKIVDGVWHSWSVLDPLEGAQFTLVLPKPVTVVSLSVWVTASKGLAVAKDVSFAGDGQPLLDATLKSEKGEQKLPLPKPATFRELTMIVRTTYPGDKVWGSLGELAGYDANGTNVLCSPPRQEPRAEPTDVLKEYQTIRAADPTRPVFMTLTGNFHPHFKKWSDEQRAQLYPAYIQAADVVGYDIYPIYGWNKPDWIHLVHDATQLLTDLAKPRPVYAWIETSKGGQYTGDLDRQKPVTPRHIRAEVWMAITGGATALGYFTHVWKPAYSQFGVPEENRQALHDLNDQLTRLAPAILGDPASQQITCGTTGDTKVAFLARQQAGDLYLFAVNYDERDQPTEARFHVEGLTSPSLQVLDEDRKLPVEDGSFTDHFEGLGVHLYRVKLAGA